MMMLSGFIPAGECANPDLIFSNFQRVFHWEGCQSFPLKRNNFYGIIHAAGQREWQADHFYAEQANQLLILTGEIYNMKALQHQHTLIGESVPEMLLDFYRLAGIGFAEQLNGDFALFIQDGEQHFLLRDHVGIIPLAYAQTEQGYFFSSDVLNLCSFLHPQGTAPDWNALLDGVRYASWTLTPTPSVKRLAPGHYLLLGKTPVPYWFPERIQANHAIRTPQATELALDLIRNSVACRLPDQQAVGCHISGGLDSGVLAAVLCDQLPAPDMVHGFSWSPESWPAVVSPYDERVLVAQTADHLQLEVTFLEADPTDPHLVDSRYYPGVVSFEEECVLRQCEQRKLHLLFSGWGGDDFISIHDPALLSDFWRSARWLRLFNRKRHSSLRKNLSFLLYKVIYPGMGKMRRIQRDYLKAQSTYLLAAFSEADQDSIRSTFFFKSRRHRHLNMLRDGHLAARCEMLFMLGLRYGVTYRYPLLDKNLIEFCLSLTSDAYWNVNEDRHLMRSMVRCYLPDSVCAHHRKTDPALNDFSLHVYREQAKRIMTDFSVLKADLRLNCINFERLESDYLLWTQGKLEDESNLLCIIYNLEMLFRFLQRFDHSQ